MRQLARLKSALCYRSRRGPAPSVVELFGAVFGRVESSHACMRARCMLRFWQGPRPTLIQAYRVHFADPGTLSKGPWAKRPRPTPLQNCTNPPWTSKAIIDRALPRRSTAASRNNGSHADAAPGAPIVGRGLDRDRCRNGERVRDATRCYLLRPSYSCSGGCYGSPRDCTAPRVLLHHSLVATNPPRTSPLSQVRRGP